MSDHSDSSVDSDNIFGSMKKRETNKNDAVDVTRYSKTKQKSIQKKKKGTSKMKNKQNVFSEDESEYSKKMKRPTSDSSLTPASENSAKRSPKKPKRRRPMKSDSSDSSDSSVEVKKKTKSQMKVQNSSDLDPKVSKASKSSKKEKKIKKTSRKFDSESSENSESEKEVKEKKSNKKIKKDVSFDSEKEEIKTQKKKASKKTKKSSESEYYSSGSDEIVKNKIDKQQQKAKPKSRKQASKSSNDNNSYKSSNEEKNGSNSNKDEEEYTSESDDDVELTKKEKNQIIKDLQNYMVITEIYNKHLDTKTRSIKKLYEESLVQEIRDADILSIGKESVSNLENFLKKEKLLKSENDDDDDDEDEDDDDDDDSDSDSDSEKESNPTEKLNQEDKIKQTLIIFSFDEKKQKERTLLKFLENNNEWMLFFKNLFAGKEQFEKLLMSKLEIILIEKVKKKKKIKKEIRKKIEKELENSKPSLKQIELIKKYDLENKKVKIPSKIKNILGLKEEEQKALFDKKLEALFIEMLNNCEENLEKDSGDENKDSGDKEDKFEKEVLIYHFLEALDEMDTELIKKNEKNLDESDYKKYIMFFTSVSSSLKQIKRKEITNFFFSFKRYTLNTFNNVTISIEKNDGYKLFEGFEKPLNPVFLLDEEKDAKNDPIENKNRIFTDQLLNLVIGNVKRSESLGIILEFVKKLTWFDDNIFFPFINPRFLICMLLAQCDLEVRLRIQENISKFSSVPFIFKDHRFCLLEDNDFFDMNFEAMSIVLDTFSVLNLNIGSMIKFGQAPEKILNDVFFTKFETSEANIYDEKCVDLNFDHNFDTSRNLSFVNFYGETRDMKLLKMMSPLVNEVIVQVYFDDLDSSPESHTIKLLVQIYKFLKEKGIHMFLIIRDCKNNEKKAKKAFKEFKKKDMVKKMFKDETWVTTLFYFSKKPKESYPKISKKILNHIEDQSEVENKMTKANFQKNFLDVEESFLEKQDIDFRTRFKKKDGVTEFLEKIIKKRVNELKNFKKSLSTVRNFLDGIQNSIEQNRYKEDFPLNPLFLEQRKLIKSIREKEGRLENRDKVEILEKELKENKKTIRTIAPTPLIKQFYNIIKHESSKAILLLLVPELRSLNKKSQKSSNEELDDLKEKIKNASGKEKNEMEAKISDLYIEHLGSAVSLETIFRNILPYLYDNDKWFTYNEREKLKKIIIDLLQSGFSIELIDGENLNFIPKFYKDFTEGIGVQSICSLGVMGPQSSGKSTLLNFQFGTMFHTSTGRCTSGLYMSIQRIEDSKSKINYLVLVDSEGLHSSERSDAEYDRKVCSFIMNNMDILIVNVKDEMKVSMTKDLEITLFSANKLKSFDRMPQIYFVFNQTSGNFDENVDKRFKQIKNMNENIEAGIKMESEYKQQGEIAALTKPGNDVMKFDLAKKFIIILGKAFTDHTFEVDDDYGRSKPFGFKSTDRKFGKDTYNFTKKILNFLYNLESKNLKDFGKFIKSSSDGWRMIDKHIDLIAYADIKSLKADIEVKKFVYKESIQFEANLNKKLDEFETQINESASQKDEKENEAFQKDLEKIQKNLENIYESLIENWKSRVMGKAKEQSSESFSETKVMDEVKKYLEKFKIKFNSMNYKINEKISSIQSETKLKNGILLIKKKALDLKFSKEFASLDNNVKKSQAKEEYKEFVKQENIFRNEQNIEEITQKLLTYLLDLGKRYFGFLPVNSFCQKPEDVTVNKCIEEFTKNLRNDEIKIIFTKKIKNSESEFRKRKSKDSEKFFKFGSLLQKSFEYRVLREYKQGFNKEYFKKECLLIYNNETDTIEEKHENLGEVLALLQDFGISLALPEEEIQEKLEEKHDQKEDLSEFFDGLLEHVSFDVSKFPKKVTKKFKAFLQFEVLNLQKEMQEEEKDAFLFCEPIGEKHQIKTSNSLSKTKEQDLKIFLNFENVESQMKLFEIMRWLIMEYFDFQTVIEEIESKVKRIVLDPTEEENGESESQEFDFRNSVDVSYEILQRIIGEMKGLLSSVDKALGVCAAELGNYAEGFLVFFSILFLWKFIFEKIEKKRSQESQNREKKKKEYRQIFMDIVMNEKDENTILECVLLLEDIMNNKKNQDIMSLSQEIKEYLNSKEVKEHFSNRAVQKDLENKYVFNCKKEDFLKSIKYINNPDQFIDEHIANLFKKHFDEKAESENTKYLKHQREILEDSLNLLEVIRTKLTEKSTKNDNVLCYFTVFKVGDSEEEITDMEEKRKYEEMMAGFTFRIFRNLVLGQEVEVSMIDNEKSIKLDFLFSKDELGEIQLNQSSGFDLLRKLVSRTQATNSQEMGIYYINKFFQKISKKIEKMLENPNNPQLTMERLQLTSIKHDHATTAKGCMVRCPFCNKKCESTKPGEHVHDFGHTGHQPQIFAGKTIERKYTTKPALVICDMICKNREIHTNGVTQTWDQITGSYLHKFRIETGRNYKEEGEAKQRLEKYDKYWQRHGDKFCERYKLENVEETFTEFLEKYNKNESDEPIHYIILFHKTNWMKSKLKFVTKGFVDFFKYLINETDSSNTFISFIGFDTKIDPIFDFECLDYFGGKMKIKFRKSPGTKLEKPLRKSIELIENNLETVKRHRIILYTDDTEFAKFPKKPIENLRSMIFSKGIDVKLNFFLKDNQSDVKVYEKVYKRCQDRLGTDNCIVDFEISPEQLKESLIDVKKQK